MQHPELPVLAITMGDAAGIGPEITARLLTAHAGLRRSAKLFVIGDCAALARALRQIGQPADRLRRIDSPAQLRNEPGTLEVLQEGPSLADLELGVCQARAGASAAEFVMRACALARDGQIDGIVTAPLNKEAMHLGGHHWPGHTELLAAEFNVGNFSLVLSSEDLFVFHSTTHVSMAQAVRDCTPERFDQLFELIGAFQRALGREGETIAVAGLNAHAGENGLFGTEERDIIAPAIERARAAGLKLEGPLPADVVWPRISRQRQYRFLVCCYHDQGHAPFKALYGEHGVNITVGLPVVRVSVDHGTAFDIAGRNAAREDSLVLAVERAAQLAPGWRQLWAASQSLS